MGLRTFKNGVHPFEGKELSKEKPVQELLPKGELVFPVSQHIGAPAKPVVKAGVMVLRGQVIAEAGGFVSSPIHSSVSGKVKKIEPRRVAVGDLVNSIIIESDGEMKEAEFQETANVTLLSKEEIIEKVKNAGVVGMGGAGFPTHVKLSPKEPDKIDYVIANCAECEPYLTSDYRRMMENPEQLVEGMKIVLQLFPKAKGIFGVENNKKDCIQKLEEIVKDDPRLEVAELMTKYPQGGERQLIYAVTKRSINSKMLPADAGCIVDNVDTIVAIYHAVTEGKPLMYRIVTVTGDAINDPRNFIVRIGTMYDELIEEAGGFKEEPAKVVSGGPMMGFGMFDLHVPTTKTASALLCLTKDDVSEMEPTACIKCGRCVEVCPQRLVPNKLMVASIHGDSETFLRLNGLECVECGCCSYTCPAKRPLTQSIKSMRKMELAKKKK